MFIENINQVYDSWRQLIDKGVQIIHPAHGRSFSVDVLLKEFPKSKEEIEKASQISLFDLNDLENLIKDEKGT